MRKWSRDLETFKKNVTADSFRTIILSNLADIQNDDPEFISHCIEVAPSKLKLIHDAPYFFNCCNQKMLRRLLETHWYDLRLKYMKTYTVPSIQVLLDFGAIPHQTNGHAVNLYEFRLNARKLAIITIGAHRCRSLYRQPGFVDISKIIARMVWSARFLKTYK